MPVPPSRPQTHEEALRQLVKLDEDDTVAGVSYTCTVPVDTDRSYACTVPGKHINADVVELMDDALMLSVEDVGVCSGVLLTCSLMAARLTVTTADGRLPSSSTFKATLLRQKYRSSIRAFDKIACADGVYRYGWLESHKRLTELPRVINTVTAFNGTAYQNGTRTKFHFAVGTGWHPVILRHSWYGCDRRGPTCVEEVVLRVDHKVARRGWGEYYVSPYKDDDERDAAWNDVWKTLFAALGCGGAAAPRKCKEIRAAIFQPL